MPLHVALGFFDGAWITAAKSVHLGDSNYLDSVWLHHSTLFCTKGHYIRPVVAMAWSLLGALGINWCSQSGDRIGILCAWEGLAVNRTTWLLARAIWVSFAIVFLVFFGLELVFRVLDEAKLPHANYTAEEIGLVSISGMPRRLYLDLPLMVLIAVAAGLGGLAQSSELTILRAAGLSIQRIFLKIILVLSPILVGSIVIAQYGMPETERFSQALKDANVSGGIKDSVWTRESGRYVFVEGAPDGSVRLWKQIEMADSRDEIERLIASSNVRFDADQVTLSKARILAFESETIRQQTNDLTQTTKLTDRQVRWLVQNPDALSLSELWDAASYLSAEGLNARAHSQLFWQRLLLPITLIALALLASATAFGSMRSLGMSTRVFLAVLIGLVFKYAMDMASPAVFLAGGHPSLAIILPLLIPLLLTPRLLR
jgi:lipopolysaccharide export system permease protein